MKKLVLTAAIAATVVLVGVVGAVSAHEVRITVACAAGGIQVDGIYFTGNPAGSEPIHSPVTVTGPEGYSESYEVTTATWSHTFPLGPNGSYHIDWPDAGQYAQDFVVDCAAPTPEPTPEPTPTSEPTPRPTPSVVGPPTPTPVRTLPPTDTD